MPIQLVQPSDSYLDAYLATLSRGWDPSSFQKTDGPLTAEIEEINKNRAKFYQNNLNFTGGGESIALPDGTRVERLPQITKWMWDGEFVGKIQFRWQHNTVALPPTCLGHIGYGVVPWKRGKGYATAALKLLLEEIHYCGLPYVELSTAADNVISQRVIAHCSGRFVENFEKLPANGGGPAKRYRINLAQA
jgi:predicted acetyltransferase